METRTKPYHLLRNEDGVVIITVLWVSALIMWFALQISAQTRLQGEEHVNQLRRSQAMHLAIGGGYEALGRMGQPLSLDADEPLENSWQPDGKPRVLNYQTGQAMVIMEPEEWRVNVNRAGRDQLIKVLERAGIEGDPAGELADVIADFVDKDDTPRLHGAEKERYEQLGLPYPPLDGPLVALDQLLLIPGITQQLFYGYGRTGEEAEAEGEETLPSVLPRKYSLFQMLTVYGTRVTLREEETGLDGQELTEQRTPWESGEIYRILSCGRAYSGSPTVVLCLIVRYTPDAENGYEILHRKVL